MFVGRRDRAPKDKQSVGRTEFIATVTATLQSIQDAMFAKALAFKAEHTRVIDDPAEFRAWFTTEREQENVPPPIHGGFAMTHFSGEEALEKQIKDELSVTVRCVPLDPGEPGVCPFTGKPSAKRVVWAKSY